MTKEVVKYVSLECLNSEQIQKFEYLIQKYSKSVLAYNLLLEQERIDKAMEYINKNKKEIEQIGTFVWNVDKLLKILKGE